MDLLQELKKLGSNLSVLYAEDDKAIQENFAIYLRKFFSMVTVCDDGQCGLEEYKKQSYDIVISDIIMPHLTGLEMLKKIKELNPTQNTIIVSSYSDSTFYLDFIKLGIDGYILKPIDFEQMNQALYKSAYHSTMVKQNEQYKENLEAMVSEKTKELQRRYITDPLTGLYNRVYLDQRLTIQGKRSLLLLNIDNFSIITDNYGFDISDKLLISISKMLTTFKEKDFKLFRVQKDEFAFLLPHYTSKHTFIFAKRIQEYFESNFVKVENLHISISFTMGIDSGDEDDILKNASMSIHEIREYGKNLIKIYEKDSNYETLQKENLYYYSKIKNIKKEDSIIPYFQAIKDIKSNETLKYEALARMIDKDQIITPDKFLLPQKASHSICEITKRMIEKSFATIANTNLELSVNITAQDLKESYLQNFLMQKCEIYSIEPKRITLEILESVSLSRSEQLLRELFALKELGFKLAIDDFGTENSNFSRLLRVDVDFIKVDGLFIKNIDTDSNSRKIAQAIVSLAHSIGAKVVAEFVHSKEVYECVKELNFDYAQGYYLGKPLSAIN